MEEGLIQIQAMATRAACTQMTAQQLTALHASVEYASCLKDRSEWDRRAAAHAEIFHLLADLTDDPVLAPALRGAVGFAYHLMLVAGPVANGMIVSSRRRLLAHMRAGDTDGAALEMEKHLRGLLYMWRWRPPRDGSNRATNR
jgi:GntR family transcriptional regulator, transcriptional repressor for pyruvate dehydrogenase complex